MWLVCASPDVLPPAWTDKGLTAEDCYPLIISYADGCMTCPAHPSRTSDQTADQLVIRLSLSPSPMAMKDDWTSMKGSSLIKAVCPLIDLKERSMCWKRKNKSNFVNESSLRRSRNNAVWPLHTYMKHVCAFALKTSVKQLLPRQEFLGTSQQSSQTAVSQSGELRRSSE